MLKYANNLKDLSRTRKGSRRAWGGRETLGPSPPPFSGTDFANSGSQTSHVISSTVFLGSFLVLWMGAINKWRHTKDWQDAEQYPHNTKKHPLEVSPRMYNFITNIRGTNFFSCRDFIRVWNSAFNCRVQTPLEIALTPVLCTLRWCYTGRFATTIFSVTQRCNVGTML